jgi:hypothetical protein
VEQTRCASRGRPAIGRRGEDLGRRRHWAEPTGDEGSEEQGECRRIRAADRNPESGTRRRTPAADSRHHILVACTRRRRTPAVAAGSRTRDGGHS